MHDKNLKTGLDNVKLVFMDLERSVDMLKSSMLNKGTSSPFNYSSDLYWLSRIVVDIATKLNQAADDLLLFENQQ